MAAMALSHEFFLTAGLLCLIAIIAGRLSASLGTPLLLVFIAVGMLAGEDGPGRIQFSDFGAAYLVGSFALAVILFEGGLTTARATIRRALGPALAMSTVGVLISTLVVGGAIVMVLGSPWPEALLLGAVIAPTDAAAVSVLLRMSRVAVPARVIAVLEVESGLNDPVSVFLTLLLVEWLLHPSTVTVMTALAWLAREMGGGLLVGVAGGYGLLGLLRWLKLDPTVFPALALGGALAIFGGAQMAGASGFLAVYLAGLILGNHRHSAMSSVNGFFGTLGWLAQITLFLMLGLLVTPHELWQLAPPALAVAAVLIFVARPIVAALCLLPFGFRLGETGFIAWVGLRGAVPIYLTLIPILSGEKTSVTLFGVVFVIVVASVAIQGWTIGPAARLFRLKGDPEPAADRAVL
jgi:cell volume regulation protein A